MSKIIGIGLILADKQKDRAYTRTLTCRLSLAFHLYECPALAKGWCIHNAMFGRGCVYGQWTQTRGFTKRAKKYHKWVAEAKVKVEEHPLPGSSKNRMVFVGEYVWLPYAHMANEGSGLPFLAHGGAFRFAWPFMKADDFTAEAIVRLAKFRPRALMGGVIAIYQRESVPLFLYHLRSLRPDLYYASVALYPDIANKTLQSESFKTRPISFRDIPPDTRIRCAEFEGMWDGDVVRMQGDWKMLPLGLQFKMRGVTGVKVEFMPRPKDTACILDDDVLMALWEEGKLE